MQLNTQQHITRLSDKAMLKMPLLSSLPSFPPYMSLPERAWFLLSRSMNLLILLFLILPILVMIPLSFSDSSFLMYPIKGFSLRWYQNLFESQEWMSAARTSFIVTPAATVIATVLGTLAAVGLNKANFRGKAILMAVLISPMIVPVVVVGVCGYLFLV